MWGWGQNDYGQLGDGTTDDQSKPMQVAELSGVTAIAAGFGHSLALKGDGSVWAWGANSSGNWVTTPSSTDTRGAVGIPASRGPIVKIAAGDTSRHV